MQIGATKYRVCTTEPVSRSEVAAAFAEHLVRGSSEARLWFCEDGTELLFRPSADSDRYFVEFRCQFHARPPNTVNYGLLPNILSFCRSHGGRIKVVRTNTVYPASGSVYADVFKSNANRIASHLAEHPKDRRAIERFALRELIGSEQMRSAVSLRAGELSN